MGARQSKRVEISGTSKKGDVENGAIVAMEEKLEKIEEGETVASKKNVNGVTLPASSPIAAEQQETTTSNAEAAAVAPETTPSKEVDVKNESVTEEVASPEKSIDAEAISPPTSPAEDSSKEQEAAVSPSEATNTEEGVSSTSEKKKKPKKPKKWSFRSFSFSKKDKQKPVASKDEPKQQETVPEGNEAVSQAEQQNDDDAEKKKKADAEQKKKDEQVPPPLPTSPPPTPAEEIAVVAAAVTSVTASPADPLKELQTVSEGDVEASGGGEALAEPLEEGELEESTTPLTTAKTSTTATTTVSVNNGTLTTITNGTNGIEEDSNGTVENGDSSSPVCELKAPIDVESVTAKIDSLKLQITTDSVESQSQSHAQNGFGDHSLNGDCNGTDMNGSSDSHLVSDSVVSVDHGDGGADASAD